MYTMSDLGCFKLNIITDNVNEARGAKDTLEILFWGVMHKRFGVITSRDICFDLKFLGLECGAQSVVATANLANSDCEGRLRIQTLKISDNSETKGSPENSYITITANSESTNLLRIDVLQMFVFFLQMGFTLILATLDGLDVCLLGDVIGEEGE
ncbi:hypothetical protein Tco_1045973 [Tanacetum coccineum]